MAFSYILSSVDSPTTCSSPVSLYTHPHSMSLLIPLCPSILSYPMHSIALPTSLPLRHLSLLSRSSFHLPDLCSWFTPR